MTTTSSKRTAPLSAAPDHADDVQVLGGPAATHAEGLVGAAPPVGEDAVAQRDERFAHGVRQLRVGGATLRLDERLLMILGGVVAPLGLVMVLLGWWGAANTPYVFEQVPYLISGGLLGVGLIFLGAFFYFAHWMTQLVKEHRAQSAAVLDALQRLHDQLTEQSATPRSLVAVAAVNGTHPAAPAAPLALVATERGTMAHRRDCVVVAGKSGVRAVTAGDGLAACKLCDPF